MWLETVVPVHSDHHSVEDLPVQSVNSESSLLSSGILDKTEAARLHFHPVQAHDEVDDLATGGEKLEKLALKGVERQVSHVEGRRRLQTRGVLFPREVCTKGLD